MFSNISKGIGNDLIRGFAFDMANEPDTAGIVLESRVVQTLCRGKSGNNLLRQTLRVTIHG